MAEDSQNVKELILALLDRVGLIASGDVQRATGLSRQAIHYHVQELLKEGAIERHGAGRGARYSRPRRETKVYPLQGLVEHLVWSEILDADERLKRLPKNVRDILSYVFTEMLNNAIDHSRGDAAEVSKTRLDHAVEFEVVDDGVGALRCVREKFDLPDYFAAIQEISKGKTTTDPQRHSGQGLFFASKAVDRFVLESDGLRWIVDNVNSDQGVGDSSVRRGTRVAWRLDMQSQRTLKSVFDEYSEPDVGKFDRSRAVVKLFDRGGETLISRSEAKRVAHDLERFNEAVIDFSGVTEVGQGFVDELFRVWASGHPQVRLTPVNMSPAVRLMVERGLPSS